MQGLSWKRKLAVLFFIIEGVILFGSVISGDFTLTLGGPIYGQIVYLLTTHIFLILGIVFWIFGKQK